MSPGAGEECVKARQLGRVFRSTYRFARMIMTLLQADPATIEADALRRENEVLKERISRLTRASTSICESLDTEDILKEIISNA